MKTYPYTIEEASELLISECDGHFWESPDGLKKRIYFNDLAQLYGFDLSFYNTGNICSATLDGERISNCQAKKILHQTGLNVGKFYYDLSDGKFHSRNLNGDALQVLARALRRKLRTLVKVPEEAHQPATAI